jgi:hypothetical protein
MEKMCSPRTPHQLKIRHVGEWPFKQQSETNTAAHLPQIDRTRVVEPAQQRSSGCDGADRYVAIG